MNVVFLVPGTWGNQDEVNSFDWWTLGSSFTRALKKRGHVVLSFPWSTDLDGVVGRNEAWEKAGLRLFKTASPGSSIIAHSHGGQVALYAAAAGLKIDVLITLGTPIRNDVPSFLAKENIATWYHCYGNYRDYWQLLGQIEFGQIFTHFRRRMSLADSNFRFPVNHQKLYTVELWNKYNLWRFLEK